MGAAMLPAPRVIFDLSDLDDLDELAFIELESFKLRQWSGEAERPARRCQNCGARHQRGVCSYCREKMGR